MARTVRLSNVFSSLVPLTDVLSIFYFALLCFLTMIDATRHVSAGLALASILCVWGNNARVWMDTIDRSTLTDGQLSN